MGYTFWPGDNSERKVSFLKNLDGMKLSTLARFRFALAIYFTLHTASHVILVYDIFWQYLTNWSLASGMITYILLAVAHCINGDFSKEAYLESDEFEKQP